MSWSSKYVVGVLLVVFSFGACTKQSQPALPPPSHTGKNIFACSVNGGTFSTEGLVQFGGFFNNGIMCYVDADSNLDIKAIAWDERSMSIGGKFHGVGSYPVDSSYPTPAGAFSAYYSDTGLSSYRAFQGTVNITYYDGNIVAGTFFFSACKTGNVVHATNGEFDVMLH